MKKVLVVLLLALCATAFAVPRVPEADSEGPVEDSDLNDFNEESIAEQDSDAETLADNDEDENESAESNVSDEDLESNDDEADLEKDSDNESVEDKDGDDKPSAEVSDSDKLYRIVCRRFCRRVHVCRRRNNRLRCRIRTRCHHRCRRVRVAPRCRYHHFRVRRCAQYGLVRRCYKGCTKYKTMRYRRCHRRYRYRTFCRHVRRCTKRRCFMVGVFRFVPYKRCRTYKGKRFCRTFRRRVYTRRRRCFGRVRCRHHRICWRRRVPSGVRCYWRHLRRCVRRSGKTSCRNVRACRRFATRVIRRRICRRY